MFPYYLEDSLISDNQSDFKFGYSCPSQLLVITLKHLSSFSEMSKLEEHSRIFQMLSRKTGTGELFINLNAMGSQKT